MTRNDLEVSAKRLANDAEQMRGRQRSLLKLSGGDRLKEKWTPEHEALDSAIATLQEHIAHLKREAAKASPASPAAARLSEAAHG